MQFDQQDDRQQQDQNKQPSQRRRIVFNLQQPRGKNINVQVDSQATRMEFLFTQCSKLSHLPVESISCDKMKFYRATHGRKTIGQLFTEKLQNIDVNQKFCKINLMVEYRAIGG